MTSDRPPREASTLGPRPERVAAFRTGLSAETRAALLLIAKGYRIAARRWKSPVGPVDVALVLDPMLATGGSVTAALMTLREWGVPRVKVLSLIAAQEGVDAVASQFPEAQIYLCQIDPVLNAQKFIVPGLGDAGDRIFNTVDPQE